MKRVVLAVWRVVIALGLLMGCGTAATADVITWTLSDITFSNGDEATGYFTTTFSGTSLTNISGINIVVTGPGHFTATIVDYPYGTDTLIGFASSGWGHYIDLRLGAALTESGGQVPIVYDPNENVDCPGCGTLNLAGHNPELIGPEPSAIILLGTFLSIVGVGTLLRRRRPTALSQTA